MISDVVGVVGELYIVSTKVVYNDALIDIYSYLLWLAFVVTLLLLGSAIIWRLVRNNKDKVFVADTKICIPIVFIICIFLLGCSIFPPLLDAFKHLATPEWYALERIERLVK